MTVLLARFHPYADDRVVVSVARVVCNGGKARIEPLSIDGSITMTAGMLAKLRYLIEQSGPSPFESLPVLRSRFWSFVKLDTPAIERKQ